MQTEALVNTTKCSFQTHTCVQTGCTGNVLHLRVLNGGRRGEDQMCTLPLPGSMPPGGWRVAAV